MFNKILVPLDGSPLAEEALAKAAELARESGGNLFLLQAITTPALLLATASESPQLIEESLSGQEEEARRYLEGTARTLRASGLTVDWAAIRGTPAVTIVDYAKDKFVDLIVMATHGRSGLSRLALGSVADQVVRYSRIPVLAIRPQPKVEVAAAALTRPQSAQPTRPNYPQLEVERVRGRVDAGLLPDYPQGDGATVSKALDQMLLEVLEQHMRSESITMEEYAELAERVQVPMVDMLMRLVADDEVRHHKLLERLAASVGDNQFWKQKAEPLPSAMVAKDPSPEVAGLVRRMVKAEAASARAFRVLARQHRDERQGLFALLLEVMAMDSKKHEHILRFISGRLEA